MVSIVMTHRFRTHQHCLSVPPHYYYHVQTHRFFECRPRGGGGSVLRRRIRGGKRRRRRYYIWVTSRRWFGEMAKGEKGERALHTSYVGKEVLLGEILAGFISRS